VDGAVWAMKMAKESRKAGMKKGKFHGCYLRWSCSNFVKHEHRWKWTAWLCGRFQRLFTPQTLIETNRLYYELLYQVEDKYPNESRHETALRYIRECAAGDPRNTGETTICQHN
jgi:hypothetical protein